MNRVAIVGCSVASLGILLAMAACSLTDDEARSDASGAATAHEADWPRWRGPDQRGVNNEKGLPDQCIAGGAGQLWTADLPGRGTPVIFGERVYTMGYTGEGPTLQEQLACFDAGTGKRLWAQGFNDFLSDIIYQRYAIGSPAVDPETGNVYCMSSAGIFSAFTGDGKLLWQHSLMEELGRMTFPNGRAGSPVVHDSTVIIHYLTSNWGGQGPPMDRFYAYDKRSGEMIWSSTPGVAPKDNSFSTPIFATRNGRSVFYVGTGCGNVACLDAVTGTPYWRFKFSADGVNSTPCLYGDGKLITVHNKENIDSSELGRLVELDITKTPIPDPLGGTPTLDHSAEVWRTGKVNAFSSSPVLVGDDLYLTTEIGELADVDARNGEVKWRLKLGVEQLHASPFYGDGKLYVPIKDGSFYVIKPGEHGGQILSKTKLEGECNGAPSGCHGRVYIQSTSRLYCFGTVRKAPTILIPAAPVPVVPISEIKEILVAPYEVLLRPGQSVAITLHGVTADGRMVDLPKDIDPKWEPFIPATAKVKAKLDAAFTGPLQLTANANAKPSAGMFEVTVGTAKGYLRGRTLPNLPFKEDFESYATVVPKPSEPGVTFAYPPLPWIGARFKWEVRDIDGNKMLVKTVDNRLLQRAQSFFGTPDMHNYTIEADVRSDGTKRKMSEVGVIDQRYAIVLKGNSQELEVNSNYERMRVSVPFKWAPKEWYHLKARVDIAADGSGVVKAKVWKRGEAEPEGWTIEVPDAHANLSGSPGIFGFSPTDMRVYIDNISVVPNPAN
jgi:outer membrane protein assembly factor BamB